MSSYKSSQILHPKKVYKGPPTRKLAFSNQNILQIQNHCMLVNRKSFVDVKLETLLLKGKLNIKNRRKETRFTKDHSPINLHFQFKAINTVIHTEANIFIFTYYELTLDKFILRRMSAKFIEFRFLCITSSKLTCW